MSNQQPMIQLLDGNKIPQLGLGVWRASQEQAKSSVSHALKSGYRHIDTAAVYENEEGVGAGIRESGINREEIFLTTKVWNTEQGFDSTTNAINASLSRLKVDYVDMLLIHWPAPNKDKFVDTWRALIQAKEQGKVRSIGVSNFTEKHIQRLIDETGVAPILNQVELHPFFQQAQLRQALSQLNVKTQAWSPLG